MPLAVWKKLPADWHATVNRQPQSHNLCFGIPAAAEWYWRMIRKAIEAVPELGGFILGREDNVTRLCDGYAARFAERDRWRSDGRSYMPPSAGQLPKRGPGSSWCSTIGGGMTAITRQSSPDFRAGPL